MKLSCPSAVADRFGDLRHMDRRQVSRATSICCHHQRARSILRSILRPPQFAYQLLSFGLIVSTALMLWKALMLLSGSGSPIVVVLSGSMEPAFQRGDLLFLTGAERVRTGQIVVFRVAGRDVPIVHRVVKVHER